MASCAAWSFPVARHPLLLIMLAFFLLSLTLLSEVEPATKHATDADLLCQFSTPSKLATKTSEQAEAGTGVVEAGVGVVGEAQPGTAPQGEEAIPKVVEDSHLGTGPVTELQDIDSRETVSKDLLC